MEGAAESSGASSANLAVVLESRVESASSTTAPRTNHTRRRILITTWGSLGDLHPYVALALGLQSRGHEAILATGECYRRKIEALGIGFRAVRPDCAWVTDPVVMRTAHASALGDDTRGAGAIASLRESYEDTLAAAEGTDLLVSNMAAYATGIVAEKKGLPWVSAMHIPTGFFSAYDPPLIPGFPGFSKGLRGLGPSFWGPFGRSINRVTSVLGRPWHRLRKEVGLPPARGFNPLTESHSPVLHLALFSKWLADKQRDWPAQTVVTGFPWFDAEGDAGLPEKLARFLDDGEPPLVFTLGTAVVADAGPFYHHSAAAAKLMGRRASCSSITHEFFYRSYRRASSLLTTLPSHFYSPARLRSSITVGSAPPDRPCVRGVLLWSCHVPGTSLTTPNEPHGWALLERSPETAMSHIALLLNSGFCSRTRLTRKELAKLQRRYGKRRA